MAIYYNFLPIFFYNKHKKCRYFSEEECALVTRRYIFTGMQNPPAFSPFSPGMKKLSVGTSPVPE
jgi:hypothetical protein